MKILINGKMKNSKKTLIDTGFFYGYGLFETILVREGIGVFIEAHLKRLNDGLKEIGLNKSVTADQVDYAIVMLQCYNGVLKVNVSEEFVVFSARNNTYRPDHYEHGARLKVSSVYRNPSSPSVYLKTMNYMDNILEIQGAKKEGWQDVLFTNFQGEVCETAVANIFFIKNDQIVTPKVSSGLLNGVVRHWVCQNFDVQEVTIKLEDLPQMQGAFISNSLLGIMKVKAIGDHEFMDHALTHIVTQAYVEVLKQVDQS